MTGPLPESQTQPEDTSLDDASIGDEEYLIRRVDPVYHVVKDPKAIGGCRIASSLYTTSSGGNDGMSVDLQASIEAAGLNAREFVSSPKYIGSIRFQVRIARATNLQVSRDPLPDNPHHGLVWNQGGKSFSKAQQKALKSNSEWLVELTGVSL